MEPSEASAFAPPDTTFRVLRISSRPARIFVPWNRYDDPRNRKDLGRPYTAGVAIWRRERFKEIHRWRLTYQRRYRAYASIAAEVGDVTNDGVNDVLHQDEQGSGGCGPHFLVATVGTREREIFRRDSCETYYRILPGALLFVEPVGPCPISDGGAHCFGGRRSVRMRWTGTRLVAASARVECSWPELDLDPANQCRKRR
jgi:hypothetical protein